MQQEIDCDGFKNIIRWAISSEVPKEIKMENVQRLNTETNSFYEDCIAIIQSLPHSKKSKDAVEYLMEKYNIPRETVYYRIRSYFGKNLSELRKDFHTPSKEELLKAALLYDTVDDFKRAYNVPAEYYKGLFNRVCGVSTYKEVKLLALKSLSPVTYNPSTKDNKAILAAFILGDGSVRRNRKSPSIRCEHSIKQYDWLSCKVNMLQKAFPFIKSNTGIQIADRSFGQTCRWSSTAIYVDKWRDFMLMPKKDLVQYLTPFGLWWLFLDDGYYYTNDKMHVAGFSVENAEIGENLRNVLLTYGITFSLDSEHTLSVKDKLSVCLFFRSIIEPFSKLTPECVQYKTICKI